MTSKEKIGDVLNEIKENSEINPDERWVEFVLNHSVIGLGILSADEQERILLKLQKDGAVKLHKSDAYGKVLVEKLPNFDKTYSRYKSVLPSVNNWNYVNPFWLIWKIAQFFAISLNWLWKHKIISALGILAGLLVYDYSTAWKNINIIWHLLRF